MRLSTKARYAVTAMVDVALVVLQEGNGKPVALSAIAIRQELPLAYLEQLFAKLRKSGLVTSARGAAGGYSLARQAQDIKILDIIMAVDMPLKATRCEKDSKTGCRTTGQRCLTHDLWDELGSVVQVFLARVSLADVCSGRVCGMGQHGLPRTSIPLQGTHSLQAAL